MNKKLLLIPTITLSAAILLTGCTSGDNGGDTPVPSGSPSASAPTSVEPTITPQTEGEIVDNYVAPPEEMKSDYKGYFFAPTIEDEMAWEYYSSIGAKTFKEDPSPRSTTVDEFNSLMDDEDNFEAGDKVYGEYFSDVEQTALNVSDYLEKKKSEATVEEINSNKDLIINRFEELGSVVVEKDDSTGFYFAIFYMSNDMPGYGILVPQDGITPDFSGEDPAK